jgi:hypothetical protein
MTRRRPRFAGPLQSPLTDSNRRPPPYHGGFELQLHGAATALISALSLQLGWFFCQSHHRLEAPRASPKNPEPVPKTCPQESVLEHRRNRHLPWCMSFERLRALPQVETRPALGSRRFRHPLSAQLGDVGSPATDGESELDVRPADAGAVDGYQSDGTRLGRVLVRTLPIREDRPVRRSHAMRAGGGQVFPARPPGVRPSDLPVGGRAEREQTLHRRSSFVRRSLSTRCGRLRRTCRCCRWRC